MELKRFTFERNRTCLETGCVGVFCPSGQLLPVHFAEGSLFCPLQIIAFEKKTACCGEICAHFIVSVLDSLTERCSDEFCRRLSEHQMSFLTISLSRALGLPLTAHAHQMEH